MSEERSAYRVKGKSGFMNNNTRNAFAADGLDILKRSVLLVLYRQPLDYTGEHRSLHQNKIREHLGIPKPLHEKHRLIPGILDLLENDEYVESYSVAHWRIREKGISVIEGL